MSEHHLRTRTAKFTKLGLAVVIRRDELLISVIDIELDEIGETSGARGHFDQFCEILVDVDLEICE